MPAFNFDNKLSSEAAGGKGLARRQGGASADEASQQGPPHNPLTGPEGEQKAKMGAKGRWHREPLRNGGV